MSNLHQNEYHWEEEEMEKVGRKKKKKVLTPHKMDV